MIRKILLACMVAYVVGGSALQAQTYSAPVRLDSLTRSCFFQLRIDTGGNAVVTKTNARFALNRGLVEVCKDFPALEKLDTVIANKTIVGGALNTDFLRIKKTFRVIGDTILVPLEWVPVEQLSLPGKTLAEAIQRQGSKLSPDKYSTFAHTLLLHPKVRKTAATQDTFLVLYYAADTKLSALTDSVSILPEYINALLDYAIADLAAMRRDFETSTFYMNRYLARKQAASVAREQELKK